MPSLSIAETILNFAEVRNLPLKAKAKPDDDESSADTLTLAEVLMGEHRLEGKIALVRVQDAQELAELLQLCLLTDKIGDKKATAALHSYAGTRATHLAKLSSGFSAGGFEKTTPVLDYCANSLTEEDLQTVRSLTLSGNAALQANTPGLLGRVYYAPLAKTTRIFELAADEVVARDLAAALSELAGQPVPVCAEFLAGLGAPAANELYNEAQVFVTGNDVQGTTCLSPLTPFALVAEIDDARKALKDEFESETSQLRQVLENDCEQLKATIKEQKKLVASLKKAKDEAEILARQQAEQALSQAEEALEKADAQLKALPKFLSLPQYPLAVGGSQPQNVGARIGKWVHRANIVSFVPTPVPRHELTPKVCHPNTLLKKVRLRNPPPFAAIGGRNVYRVRQNRLELLNDVCHEVLKPLKELQSNWRRFEGQPHEQLSEAAVAALTSSSEPWALFVKSDAHLDPQQRKASRKELAEQVFSRANESLVNAYPEKWLHEFDVELDLAALATVNMEHA